jgi:hypothetical protein
MQDDRYDGGESKCGKNQEFETGEHGSVAHAGVEKLCVEIGANSGWIVQCLERGRPIPDPNELLAAVVQHDFCCQKRPPEIDHRDCRQQREDRELSEVLQDPWSN